MHAKNESRRAALRLLLLGGAALTVTACASTGDAPDFIRKDHPDYTPDYILPSSTDGYMPVLFPGVGEKFDPHPQFTASEIAKLSQLDWYADDVLQKVGRNIWGMMKTGLTYAILEGVLTMLGAMVGFGSAIKPASYLAYAAGSGLGGGLANAEEQFRYTMKVAKGYLMTMLVYKADELQDELRRMIIIPLLSGSAPRPTATPGAIDPFADAPNKKKLAPPPPPG